MLSDVWISLSSSALFKVKYVSLPSPNRSKRLNSWVMTERDAFGCEDPKGRDHPGVMPVTPISVASRGRETFLFSWSIWLFISPTFPLLSTSPFTPMFRSRLFPLTLSPPPPSLLLFLKLVALCTLSCLLSNGGVGPNQLWGSGPSDSSPSSSTNLVCGLSRLYLHKANNS